MVQQRYSFTCLAYEVPPWGWLSRYLLLPRRSSSGSYALGLYQRLPRLIRPGVLRPPDRLHLPPGTGESVSAKTAFSNPFPHFILGLMKRSRLLSGILTVAFVAGTLDLAAAMARFTWATGASPVRVLQYIASGLLGAGTFTVHPFAAWLGLLLHFAIATFFTALYFAWCAKWPWPRRRPLVAGLGYGTAIWLVMNGLVVPLSRTPARPFHPVELAFELLTLLLCVGLPIALLAARYFRRWHFQKRIVGRRTAHFIVEPAK